jgi:hypothetical protein
LQKSAGRWVSARPLFIIGRKNPEAWVQPSCAVCANWKRRTASKWGGGQNGEVVTNPDARAKTDYSIRGWKTMMKKDPIATRDLTDRIIKNTYRTLMTRGMKGCYIWSADEETRDWFR